MPAPTIENTNIPKGSSRLLPTGNFALSLCSLHCTSLFVVHTISVHSRSNAESTNDAISDSDDEKYAAMHFAISSKIFAITLICAPERASATLPPHSFQENSH